MANSFTKFNKDQSGNILLLALLIMSGIVGAGVTLATIVISQIRQGSNIESSLVAYYAAESGVEKNLYDIRKTDTPWKNMEDLSGELGKASWTSKIESREKQIFRDLKQNDTLQVDLFDPDQISGGAGVGVLRVDWEDGCEHSSIEMSITAWTPGAGWADNTVKFLYSSGSETNNSFDTDMAYRVRIKALYCDINNLAVRAYDTDNKIVPIPARVIINSVGSFSGVKQAIQATMPRISPMSGLYDYVLFSEESIVK